MLTHFICPDGETCPIDVCTKENGCRLGKRCLTRPTLMELAKQRVWRGIPSVTQLIKGTLEAYRDITVDYSQSPDDMMFRLLGTSTHLNLEGSEVDSALVEGDMSMVTSDGISMTPDLYETEGDWGCITDYKTSGAYKVAKALGMYCVLREADDEYYKMKTKVTDPETGKIFERVKGDKKLVKIWYRDISRQDCRDWVLQQNYYRLGMEEVGFKVDELRIQAILRDGGLQATMRQGLDKKVYLIPLPIMPDHEVRTYFLNKRDRLLALLDGKEEPVVCSAEESWNGRKCRDYCNTRHTCPFNIHQIQDGFDNNGEEVVSWI